MGQFEVTDHRQTVESIRLHVAYSGRKKNHLHVTQTFIDEQKKTTYE